MTSQILLALLSLYRQPHPQRECLAARHDMIVERADASAARFGVPVVLILTTAWLESHIACDTHEHSWGAPINRRHRHTAGGPDQEASSLLLGFNRCHSWLRAVHHFRSGSCHSPHLAGYQPQTAIDIAERTMARAGVELPEHWR